MAKPKTVSAVGLDIGNYSVKFIEMLRTPEAIKLQQANVFPLSNSTPEALTEVLKQVFSAFLTPPKHVRIAVSGPSVITRCVNLPVMTEAELAGAIRFEAESHIPFPIDECILDSQILRQLPDKKMMNVLLVAAKRDFIQERLKLLSEFGVKPELVDTDTLCLVNSFEMLNDVPDQKTYALLNIGHHVSLFVIVLDTLPFFVRDIAHGGMAITQTVMEMKGISEVEADPFKMNRSFENLNDLKLASQKGFGPLVDELKQFIDYFENEVGEELKFVWLSGGAAMSIGAPVVFSELLGKQVSLWDNTRKLEISGRLDLKFLKEHCAELNVAFGLALRNSGSGE